VARTEVRCVAAEALRAMGNAAAAAVPELRAVELRAVGPPRHPRRPHRPRLTPSPCG
jgi:hypothetical protein